MNPLAAKGSRGACAAPQIFLLDLINEPGKPVISFLPSVTPSRGDLHSSAALLELLWRSVDCSRGGAKVTQQKRRVSIYIVGILQISNSVNCSSLAFDPISCITSPSIHPRPHRCATCVFLLAKRKRRGVKERERGDKVGTRMSS